MSFEIDARFALGPRRMHLRPNELDDATRLLLDAATGKQVDIKEVLERFPHLDAFQKALGMIVSKPPYDPEIQEAYWIGSDLLARATGRRAGEALLACYHQHTLPVEYLNELERLPKEETVLHHNFQVTRIAVLDAGGLSGSLKAVNNCLARAAEVIEQTESGVRVSTVILVNNNGYRLDENEEVVKTEIPLHKNDNVVLHWGSVVQSITSRQRKQLEKWTKKIIEKL